MRRPGMAEWSTAGCIAWFRSGFAAIFGEMRRRRKHVLAVADRRGVFACAGGMATRLTCRILGRNCGGRVWQVNRMTLGLRYITLGLALATSLSAAHAQTPVNVGITDSSSDAVFFIADKRGYFKAEGLATTMTSFASAA